MYVVQIMTFLCLQPISTVYKYVSDHAFSHILLRGFNYSAGNIIVRNIFLNGIFRFSQLQIFMKLILRSKVKI